METKKSTFTHPVIYFFVLCLHTLLLPLVLVAQGTKADYQRADYIKEVKQDRVYDQLDGVVWQQDGRAFLYHVITPEGKEYRKISVPDHKKETLFTQQQVAGKLAGALGKEIDPKALALSELSVKKTDIHFTAQGHKWVLDLTTGELKPTGKVQERPGRGYWGMRDLEREAEPVYSPDSQMVAFIKNANVYVRTVSTNEEHALSFDGSPGEYYSGRIAWSPDSKKLAVNKIRPNAPRTMYLIESSPIDQLQPKLHTRNYLKPGDALPVKQPMVFLANERKQVEVPIDSIPNQYAITDLIWRKDSRSITFEYNQRGHQAYNIMELNAENGQVTALVKETSPTFIDYSGKRYRYDCADGQEIIWASERDGWNHLYLYDGNGRLKHQITKGEWVVRRVIHVDEEDRSIIFAASGKNTEQDPYFMHYYRIGFDGRGLVALTDEDGNHDAQFSPDYRYFVDTWSRLDQAPVSVLKSAKDGKLITNVEKANIDALLKTGWELPEIFSSKGRDGKTDIWGMIIRPSNFDPSKKYPVIEYIYAGPQGSFVPKNFVPDSRGELHELAELGFIVVQCDGMGTSNRSKAFHDVCWQNLKDGGFPDRIAWMRAAAKKHPYMDLERVGIFGNSAGGQNAAAALLFHPEFYKVAVSSSGCHDNRMDKMWWNEQWMGYPIGPQYAASSNVDNAHLLQGKLLLILGELDDNVDPSSTLQVVNALIKANKDFDFLMVPGMGHSLGGDYGEHKRRDFFVKHLLKVDPPVWEGMIL